jgi:fructose-bisphosphate aldolase class I
MNNQKLETTTQSLVSEGKGILAADESFPTIQKRFDQINLVSTKETRRDYRQMLFTTESVEASISGVILFDETLRQSTQEGVPLSEILTHKGIIPGIKVDKGAKPMAGFPGERVTEGLDGLRDRLTEYSELGARFAKWRAVITIDKNTPTNACIGANAHALARYAALCQEVGLVPIVEPEVLMDGDHDLQRCEQATTLTLKCVFAELYDQRVLLEGMLLKPSMVIFGKECPQQAGVAEVAEATVRCLRRAVPAAMPGIVFLSGGQSSELATEHLNAMNAMGDHPWELSFSYGRALQQPALNAWRGEAANVTKAQAALSHRAKCNSAARYGKYSNEMETM